MKVRLRTVMLENVIWADFRPLYRGLRLGLDSARRGPASRLGRSIGAPQNVGNIRPQRLRQQRQSRVLHVLGVAGLKFTERRLR